MFKKLVLLFITLVSIPSTLLGEEASPPLRFCDIEENSSSADAHLLPLWGAKRVSLEVTKSASMIRHSIFSAYTTTYIAMTGARDYERCFGDLRADNLESELIGDKLADIMSRTYIFLAEKCVNNPKFDPNYSGFCTDLREVQSRNHDALTATLLSTATYLSSHMASSLVAVIYDDLFWSTFPDSETHASTLSSRETLEKRISWVRKYKPLFDKNNQFLAKNFEVVLQSLYDGCYLKSNLSFVAQELAKLLPASTLLFGNIRDRTFSTAIEVARKFANAPSLHPLIISSEGLHTIRFGNYEPWSNEPQELIALKRSARNVFYSPFSSVAYQLIGGVKQSEYERKRANGECTAF